MAFPIVQKYFPAGMLLNQRISFSSVVAVMGGYISGIGNFLVSKGYTVVGSSDGTSAAMDGVNRCTTAAGYAVQGASATSAQSWLCLRAANGAQTLFCYQGSQVWTGRVSFSPGGLFVLAGTATFQPTATDEQVFIAAGTDLVNSNASNDRIFNVWVDSAANGWRACLFRLNVMVGTAMGVELFDTSFLQTPVSAPVPVWGFAYNASNISNMFNGGTSQGAGSVYVANLTGGLARLLFSGTPITAQLGATWKSFGGQSGPELDGISLIGNGNLVAIRTLGLFSLTSNVGDVGNRFDWHFCHDRQACGNFDSSKSWILLNNQTTAGSSGGCIWPWDGASSWVGS